MPKFILGVSVRFGVVDLFGVGVLVTIPTLFGVLIGLGTGDLKSESFKWAEASRLAAGDIVANLSTVELLGRGEGLKLL